MFVDTRLKHAGMTTALKTARNFSLRKSGEGFIMTPFSG
jgi:hypothetical protein